MTSLLSSPQLKDPSLLVQGKGYINGEWVGADSGSTFKVLNKATQAELGSVPDMTTSDTQRAISAASTAFSSWKTTTGKYRGDLLTKLYNALQENVEDLAKIIVAENGKPLAEAKGEMAYSNGFMEWYAAEAQRTYGTQIPSPQPHLRNVVLRQPVGVCALITVSTRPMTMAGCTDED